MSNAKQVSVLYFTDVLCIWAYIAQIRMDQLKVKYGAAIAVEEHFVSVFGSVGKKMENSWGARGGIAAYNAHVLETASKFDHIQVHPEVWIKNTPTSSGSAHLFLKAVQILQERNEIAAVRAADNTQCSAVEAVAWQLRIAFFRDLVDISALKSQLDVAAQLQLPVDAIQRVIESGAAFDALECDLQLKQKYGVVGSPSLVLNEGRQLIYGNVGYRVIEANIQELLNRPENQASWC